MKITEKINELKIGEELREGVCDSQIIFKKFKYSLNENQINLQISYLNTSIVVEHAENGIDDYKLGASMKELKTKHLERVDMSFFDFNRYNCGWKFDI